MTVEAPPGTAAHRLFIITLALKAALGIVQLASGIAMTVIPPDGVIALANTLVRVELAEDPADPLALLLKSALSTSLSVSDRHFYTIYLILHGTLNTAVAAALAYGHRAAYSVSIAILVAFVGYQLWKYAQTSGVMLLILTAIDVIVIVLSVIEMRQKKQT